jgi:rhamnose utilization protein RhaD (predicted bifunctional aldolase and dehydrogenase)/NAD(P)-dependent dehydrogenase (short-subunit alcohol dehydrogenase family)/TolA-binding protein
MRKLIENLESKLAARDTAIDRLKIELLNQQAKTPVNPTKVEAHRIARLEAELQAERDRNARLAANLADAKAVDGGTTKLTIADVDQKANVQVLLARAARDEANGNSEAATWNYKRVLELNPNEHQALLRMGNILTESGDFEAAERYLMRAFYDNPDSMDILLPLGFLLSHRGKADMAVSMLSRAVALYPDNLGSTNQARTQPTIWLFFTPRPSPLRSAMPASGTTPPKNSVPRAIRGWSVCSRTESAFLTSNAHGYTRMKNLWNDTEAAACGDDVLALRVYTSRLLGQEPDLVLHGGGNTSAKGTVASLFGNEEEVLFVKGSGWDLATIEAPGFSPVSLKTLQRMADLEVLTDSDMVKAQRAAMTDSAAPTPSVEAILHALIPFRFVDHTHADAVVTITNSPGGEARIREVYGSRVLIIPYVMPGFILSRTVREMTRDADWSTLDGLILMNHGIFTFADSAKASYDLMIELVTMAEDYLVSQDATSVATAATAALELSALADLRKAVSDARGRAVITRLNCSQEATGFANLNNAHSIAARGPLTPDHVIRTKRVPLMVGDDADKDLDRYAREYRQYFATNATDGLTCLDPAPRWAVWPGIGTVAFGCTPKEVRIIDDITAHTMTAIQRAEQLGGWEALPASDIFEVEYWELEQAKLAKAGTPPALQGKIAIVTGAASGIGKACAEALAAAGAVVGAVDVSNAVNELRSQSIMPIVADLTDDSDVNRAVAETVTAYGGIDIFVSNAGSFPPSARLEAMDAELWDKSMTLNLTSHQRVLTACTPYLKRGIDPAVVVIASKNVPAPGPGAAAYSVAKAGLTQLARVAALELGEHGVRVNILHPNAVFDTGIWSDEVLAARAASYNMSVDEYKRNNLLKTPLVSADVAALAVAMAGPLFSKTTGAQIPIDGGNERVV